MCINNKLIEKQLPQFAFFVAECLEKTGLESWLDSGTLLGLIRDKKLLPGDKDVDVGVFADNEDKIERLIDLLRNRSRVTTIRSCNGKIFKLKLLSKRHNRHELTVDLNIFRTKDASLICPALRFKNKSLKVVLKRGKIATVAWELFVRNLLWRPFGALEINWPVFSTCYYKEIWELKKDLLLPVTQIDNGPFYLPKDVGGYLEYRYGEWKIPRSDWIFHLHDGGYRCQPPEIYKSEVVYL